MATATAGQVTKVSCPLASTITVTPGTVGSCRVFCNGRDSFPQQTITAAASFLAPAGSDVFIEAIGADATYTDGLLTSAQAAAVAADLASRGLVVDPVLSNYFRTDKKFASYPSGVVAIRRYTCDQLTGALVCEITGATATATAAPTATMHPLIASRKSITYNGSTQRHELPSTSDCPIAYATPWSISVTATPNVTRSGGAASYTICGDAISGGTAKGVTLSFRWDGTSKTLIQVFVTDDFGANRYFAFYGSTDLANGTPYTIGVTWNPNFGAGGTQDAKLIVTINGAKESSSTVTRGASLAAMTNFSSGQALRIGGNYSTAWAPMALQSFTTFKQAISLDQWPAVSAVERGTAKRNLVIESDCCDDPEDLAAIALAAAIAKSGTADLMAVVIDSANAYSAVAARALLNYYGLNFVPVIATQGTVGVGGTNDAAKIPTTPSGTTSYTSTWTQAVRDAFLAATDRTTAIYNSAIPLFGSTYGTPLLALRAVLSACADDSVEYCMVGFAGGIAELAADSGGSPAGVTLIASKARRITIMGGRFAQVDQPFGEYNVRNDSTAFLAFLTALTTGIRVNWQESTIGEAVTAAPFSGKSTAVNPGALAWSTRFGATTTTNYTWDSLGVLGAIAGQALFSYTGPGRSKVIVPATSGGSEGWTQLDYAQPTYPHYYSTFQSGMSAQASLLMTSLRSTWLP